MDIEIAEITHGTPLYGELTALRHTVLRAPLGLSFTAEELAAEKADTHIAAILQENDRPRIVGSILLKVREDSIIQIKRMAIAEDMQGRGIGEKLLKYAEDLARQRGFALVMMHARQSAAGFYRKFGFYETGVPFDEQGIPHIRMEKSTLL